jgi:hypothetical protein
MVKHATLVSVFTAVVIFMFFPSFTQGADLTAELCGTLITLIDPEYEESENVKTPFTVDTVEGRQWPVRHCYVHGTLAHDSRYRILLPENWNGKFVLLNLGERGDGEDVGGDELLAMGYALAQSNLGHAGPILEQQDKPRAIYLIQNHQLAHFARGKIEDLYGSRPRRTYLYGYSDGGYRSTITIRSSGTSWTALWMRGTWEGPLTS